MEGKGPRDDCGVGTQTPLGYRVDTYEATAYALGDAFLGHVIPEDDARKVGQKARKCRAAPRGRLLYTRVSVAQVVR